MVTMLAGKRAVILAAIIAYMRSKHLKVIRRTKPRSLSSWRLARVLDIVDPVSAEVNS